MFDKLQIGQPVERFNWSIQAGDALYHPLSNAGRIDRATGRPIRFPDVEAAAARVHPRRAADAAQAACLGRHPVHDPHLSRSDWLAGKPPGPGSAGGVLRRAVLALDAEQLDYKGLTADRDRLVEALSAIG